MSFLEEAIWQNRFAAITNRIIDTFNDFDNVPQQDWEKIIKGTLGQLHRFSTEQFNFFMSGFQQSKLISSPKYKPEFAVRKTLDQMSYDLEVLQRALYQRKNGSDIEKQTLALADKLGVAALQPALSAKLIMPTDVITYFQKSANVRVIPYAPVALVGIPYSCTDIENNARDFLSIPHEMGHYVYWHGKLPENRNRLRTLLFTQSSLEPPWLIAWLEEIFADLYGAIVAGSVIALDFQELLFDNLDLAEADGEHPVAAYRPRIYTNLLTRLRNTTRRLFIHSPEKLNKLWDASLEKKGNPKEFTPFRQNGALKAISFTEVDKKIRGVISDIVRLLDLALPSKTGLDVWGDDATEVDQKLYDDFRDKILTPLMSEPYLQQFKEWDKWTNGKIEINGILPEFLTMVDNNQRSRWLEIFKFAQKEMDEALPPETWSTLLDGTGWAVGGPEGEGNPPVSG